MLQQIDSFEFAIEDVPSFNQQKTLKNITSEYFKAILESEEMTKYLFPYKRMVFASFPYKIYMQNVPHLFEQENVLYSDVERSGEREDIRAGLLSASTFLSVSRSLCVLNIDVFGTDITTLDRHILAHLTHLKKTVNNGNVRLYLCSEEGLPVNGHMKSIFQFHGATLLKPSKQINRLKRLYVFELDKKKKLPF